MSIKIHNAASFQEYTSSHSCVVDWTASWCGPCQRIAPIFEQLASEFPNVKFLKVDVDECQQLSQLNGVSAMPTFHFYSGGQKVDEMRGADPNALRQKVESLAQNAGPSTFAGQGQTLGGGNATPASDARAAALAAALARQMGGSSNAPINVDPPSSSTAPDNAASGNDPVDALFVEQLAAMGFNEDHALQGLKATRTADNRLEAAIDWCVSNPATQEAEATTTKTTNNQETTTSAGVEDEKNGDTTDTTTTNDETTQANEGEAQSSTTNDDGAEATSPTVHNALCDVCHEQILGTRYKCDVCDDFDLCGDHYVARAHDNLHKFTAHTEDIQNPKRRQLTEEELAEKKAELTEKLARLRKERDAKEAKEKHERELKRIREAKESQANREQFKKRAAEIEMAQRKRERLEHKKHEAKIRRQIAQDKAERKAAAEARRRAASGESPVAKVESKPSPTPVVTSTPAKEYTECTIAVRLPNGTQTQKEFPVETLVRDVATWACAEAGCDVVLKTTFPRTAYTGDKLQLQLKQVDGMVPRGLFVASRR